MTLYIRCVASNHDHPPYIKCESVDHYHPLTTAPKTVLASYEISPEDYQRVVEAIETVSKLAAETVKIAEILQASGEIEISPEVSQRVAALKEKVSKKALKSVEIDHRFYCLRGSDDSNPTGCFDGTCVKKKTQKWHRELSVNVNI